EVPQAAGRSETRVCNGVCNWFGHTGAQPGTTWHNRGAAEPPQAPTRGTPGHDLARRGTTWHDSPPRLRVLQGLPFLPPNSGEKRGFGEVGSWSVQSSVQWPWSQLGTTWHNVARPRAGGWGPLQANLRSLLRRTWGAGVGTGGTRGGRRCRVWPRRGQGHGHGRPVRDAACGDATRHRWRAATRGKLIAATPAAS